VLSSIEGQEETDPIEEQSQNGSEISEEVLWLFDREDQTKPLEYTFIEKVACEVVERMGGRPGDAAQLKAARLLAYRIMRDHNHRKSHVERDLPKILALVCTPTAVERQMEVAITGRNYMMNINSNEVALAGTFILGHRLGRSD